MNINLDDIEIDIECPSCGFVNKATMGDVRVQAKIICRGCKANIQLVNENGSIDRAQNSINESFDSLEKTIKKINTK